MYVCIYNIGSKVYMCIFVYVCLYMRAYICMRTVYMVGIYLEELVCKKGFYDGYIYICVYVYVYVFMYGYIFRKND